MQSPLDRPKTPKDAAVKDEEANGDDKEVSEASTLIRSNSYIKNSVERPTTSKECRKPQESTNGTEENGKDFWPPYPVATTNYYLPRFKAGMHKKYS